MRFYALLGISFLALAFGGGAMPGAPRMAIALVQACDLSETPTPLGIPGEGMPFSPLITSATLLRV